MACRTIDIETPDIIRRKRQESFTGRLSRAEDEADNGDKDVAKMHNERGAHRCARIDAIGKGNPPLYEQGIGEPSRAGCRQDWRMDYFTSSKSTSSAVGLPELLSEPGLPVGPCCGPAFC